MTFISDYSLKEKAILLAVWFVSWALGYWATNLVLWLFDLVAYDWVNIIVACIVAVVASDRLDSFFAKKKRKKREREYEKLFDDAGI